MANMRSKAMKLGLGVILAVLIVVVIRTVGILPSKTYKTVNTDSFGVAIKGYDPVAYFTEGHPVPGSEAFEYRWQDARWRFASAAHQQLFAANPERYSPQYGGY